MICGYEDPTLWYGARSDDGGHRVHGYPCQLEAGHLGRHWYAQPAWNSGPAVVADAKSAGPQSQAWHRCDRCNRPVGPTDMQTEHDGVVWCETHAIPFLGEARPHHDPGCVRSHQGGDCFP